MTQQTRSILHLCLGQQIIDHLWQYYSNEQQSYEAVNVILMAAKNLDISGSAVRMLYAQPGLTNPKITRSNARTLYIC